MICISKATTYTVITAVRILTTLTEGTALRRVPTSHRTCLERECQWLPAVVVRRQSARHDQTRSGVDFRAARAPPARAGQAVPRPIPKPADYRVSGDRFPAGAVEDVQGGDFDALGHKHATRLHRLARIWHGLENFSQKPPLSSDDAGARYWD